MNDLIGQLYMNDLIGQLYMNDLIGRRLADDKKLWDSVPKNDKSNNKNPSETITSCLAFFSVDKLLFMTEWYSNV